MIPRAYITHWRNFAPWPDDAQVEQDLLLSRTIVELFQNPTLQNSMAFRGGTALHKMFFKNPVRYSEDIDLVQIKPEPIGPALTALRTVMGPWLGEPKLKQGQGRATLYYRFESTMLPVKSLRLKIEINTREHYTVLGYLSQKFDVESPWYTGSADVNTYHAEELLGTKMRALYQRKKGRDLYDLWFALSKAEVLVSEDKIITCFLHYMKEEGHIITRALFEKNLSEKKMDPVFMNDMGPLLKAGMSYDPGLALDMVQERLISGLPGLPWKG